MNKFLSILKLVGGFALQTAVIAGPAAATILGGPGLNALVTTVLSSVIAAEQQGVSGAEKKAKAMAYLAVGSVAIVQMIEQATGRELADEERFRRALDRMVDALVDLLDSFAMLPKKQTA